MRYILAVDQGTSSTRAMIYSTEGDLITLRQYPITSYYPKPGWVEQDPEEIWQKTLQAMQEVVKSVPLDAIISCGITNQRETTLLWDTQTGRCLHRAIVWQDRRTQVFCDALKEEAETIHQKTGLFPDPYFSASKLCWLFEQVPEARSLAKKNQLAFGTIDCFLIWRLTAGTSHYIDSTNASRTMLYNIFTHQWDEELLKRFNIPKTILPQVLASDAHFGLIKKEHLGKVLPITAVAGDQQASLIGQRCIDKGMIKATFGTGAFILLNTGEQPVFSRHRLLTTIASHTEGKIAYGLEGSIYHAGTTIKWLRDEMHLIDSAAETEALAKSLIDNEGVYLVPSFTGLGAPHHIAHAGAMITGLSRQTKRAHIARAALESVVYQTRDVLTCMIDDSAIAVKEIRVDGGMAENDWMLQFLATQCQLTVHRPPVIETTSIGIALLAGISYQGHNMKDFLLKTEEKGYAFIPDKPNATDQAYLGWQQALNMLKAAQ